MTELIAQTVKNLPETQKTQVKFLDWKDPLEKGLATHSSILAWRIPRTEDPGRLQSMGPQRVRYDLRTNTTTTKSKMGTLLVRGVSKDDISFVSGENLIPPRIYFKFVLDGKFLSKCCIAC